MIVCMTCGHSNERQGYACGFCGAALTRPATAETGHIEFLLAEVEERPGLFQSGSDAIRRHYTWRLRGTESTASATHDPADAAPASTALLPTIVSNPETKAEPAIEPEYAETLREHGVEAPAPSRSFTVSTQPAVVEDEVEEAAEEATEADKGSVAPNDPPVEMPSRATAYQPDRAAKQNKEDAAGIFSERNINTLLYLGVLIFGLGLAVFVHNQWQDFDAIMKFGILLASSCALMGVGYVARHGLKLPATGIAFTALGAFTLPIDLYAAVYYDAFPVDGFAMGAFSCPLFALLYLALTRRTRSELFTYGSVAAATASVWFSARLLDVSAGETWAWLVFVPMALQAIERMFCTERFVKDAELRTLYGRPLRFGTLPLMALFATGFLFLQVIPNFGAANGQALRLAGAAAVGLFFLWGAIDWKQPALLFVSAAFQYVIVKECAIAFGATRLWEPMIFGAWALLYFGVGFVRDLRLRDSDDVAALSCRVTGFLIFSIAFGVIGFNVNHGAATADLYAVSGLLALCSVAAASCMLLGDGAVSALFLLLPAAGAALFFMVARDAAGATIWYVGCGFALAYSQLGLLVRSEKYSCLSPMGSALACCFGLINVSIGLNLSRGDAMLPVHGLICVALAGAAALSAMRYKIGGCAAVAFVLLQFAVEMFCAWKGRPLQERALAMSALSVLPLLLPARRFEWLRGGRLLSLIAVTALPLFPFLLIPTWTQSMWRETAMILGVGGAVWMVEGLLQKSSGAALAHLLLWSAAMLALLKFLSTGVPNATVLCAFPVFYLLMRAAATTRAFAPWKLASSTLSGIAAVTVLQIMHYLHVIGQVDFDLVDLMRCDAIFAALTLTGALLLPRDEDQVAAVLTFCGGIFSFAALRLWLLHLDVAATWQVFDLQAASLLCVGMAWSMRARDLQFRMQAALSSVLICQALTVGAVWPEAQPTAIAFLFAGAGSFLGWFWSRNAVFPWLTVLFTTLGAAWQIEAFQVDVETWMLWAGMIAAVHALSAVLFREFPEWRDVLRVSSVLAALVAGALLMGNLDIDNRAVVHAAFSSLALVAVAFGALHTITEDGPFDSLAAAALLFGYYIELVGYNVTAWEAYTLPLALPMAFAAWRRSVKGEREFVTMAAFAVWLGILPSFLQGLPETPAGGVHAFYTLGLCVCMLVYSMVLRHRQGLFTSGGLMVMMVLIKAAQFIQIQNLSRAQWGMLIGGILMALGVAAELRRKRIFESRLARAKSSYNEFFRDWK